MDPRNPSSPTSPTSPGGGSPYVTNPTIDLGMALSHVMGDTGGVQEALGGFRIKVYHTRAFPWGEVLKMLVYRDFKVYVTRHKADLYIEATF